jgi:hypothetical protein
MDINFIVGLLLVIGAICMYIVYVRGGLLFTVISFSCWVISAGIVATDYPLIILVYIGLMVMVVLWFLKNAHKGE